MFYDIINNGEGGVEVFNKFFKAKKVDVKILKILL